MKEEETIGLVELMIKNERRERLRCFALYDDDDDIIHIHLPVSLLNHKRGWRGRVS